ncbi:ABC transporter ATP-binding protein [Arcobacter cloacae]|uniref:ABC transporter ATP-binding protein n=1 Tax=Arcobacter cloacae TaxID=1054034 RepID=A0A6M8NT78_9BACT|nr:ATP-binding cassette domain-containing protein [Arcobacter cloacae]QKF91104.1 nitrate/sulfonate/bicarbonate ABC transporter, ATP-binding protein [Arcobacter cloacae]RXI38927.1 ABC transporter ATP-binding protein [Arcobacter cloacae]
MEGLKVEELNFYFGFTQILKDINFELNENKIISIVGPSGGGKTTLLKLCAGLLDVTEGTITNNFGSSSFAFQDARLLPWKNVIENIMLPIIAKLEFKKAYSKACDIALRFGLEEKDFKKYPKDLSGGMKQRVNFARALICEPKLLFLDEPFSALDIGLKKELQDFVLENSKIFGTSVLFITHDLMEAIRLSDEILLLKSDPGEILKTYKIEYPKELRDDNFVFSKTKEFLDDKDVIKTFEIKVR